MATNQFIDAGEFISALDALSKERRINKEVLFSAIEVALITAFKKNYGKTANVRASIDRMTGAVEVLSCKTVVEEVEDPICEMTLEEAREINRRYELGDLVEVPVTPRNFGRIAAQTAKQVVVQHIREAERGCAARRPAHPRGRARRHLRRVFPEGNRDPHRYRAEGRE